MSDFQNNACGADEIFNIDSIREVARQGQGGSNSVNPLRLKDK